jgi:UDPglucose 6-dehydrogenase
LKSISVSRNIACSFNSAVFIAKHLIAERARLEVYDPLVPASQSQMYKYYNAAEGVDNVEKLVTIELDVYEACKGAHAIAIITEREFMRQWSDIRSCSREEI